MVCGQWLVSVILQVSGHASRFAGARSRGGQRALHGGDFAGFEATSATLGEVERPQERWWQVVPGLPAIVSWHWLACSCRLPCLGGSQACHLRAGIPHQEGGEQTGAGGQNALCHVAIALGHASALGIETEDLFPPQ
eukprot:189814-Amphidinium_carterae.1